jgi:hypothetical protein
MDLSRSDDAAVMTMVVFEGTEMMCAWRRNLDHAVEALEPRTLQ